MAGALALPDETAEEPMFAALVVEPKPARPASSPKRRRGATSVTRDGAPKWEVRVVSLNKWSASRGRYKSQIPHTPEFAGRFIYLIFFQTNSPFRQASKSVS